MRIQLKALFILVAIAAGISSWLAQRRTPLLPGALVQIVDPIQTNRASKSRNTDFESAFYSLLINKLTAKNPEILIGMSDPNKQLREEVRLESVSEGDFTTLYTVHAWGNALTSDRERLKAIMNIAFEALNTLSKNQSRASSTKILSVPSL